ncbi:MAG: NUDIX hydrolase [Acidimicrobiia bacterium]
MTANLVVPVSAASVIVVVNSPLEVLMMRRPSGGMFGDAWVFPGGVLETSDGAVNGSDLSAFRLAASRELLEEAGVAVNPGEMVFVSRWVTPVELPRRYDTRFFLAVVASRPPLTLALGEVMEAAFVSPATALVAHQAQQWRMVLPTVSHLRWLSRFGTGAEAERAAAAARPEPIQARLSEDGSVVEVEIPR